MAKSDFKRAEPWLAEYDAMFADGVTRVFVVMTPDHAAALSRGEVPDVVRHEAAMLCRTLEGRS